MQYGVRVIGVTLAALLTVTGATSAQRGRGAAAPEGPPTAFRLDVTEGSKAGYRVREQLAGLSFPSDAVGSTSDVKGALVIKADGTLDNARSKITVDLRTLKSDQDMRDGFMRGERGLNTAKFDGGVCRQACRRDAWPLPSGQQAQTGFQLVGNMTLYGTTSEISWNVVITLNAKQVAGRATTEFPFTSSTSRNRSWRGCSAWRTRSTSNWSSASCARRCNPLVKGRLLYGGALPVPAFHAVRADGLHPHLVARARVGQDRARR